MEINFHHKELIKRIVRQRDKSAFDEFYNYFYPKLVRYAIRLTGEQHLAEDVVSDLFLTFLQKSDRYLNVKKVESYLYYIVRNECLRVIKKEKLQVHGDLFVQIDVDELTPLSAMEFNELCDILDRAIEKMPPKRKEIFHLIREKEMKYKEVAKELNLSVKTIENQMTKAISFLRERIDSEFKPKTTGKGKKGIFNHALLVLLP